MEEEGKRARASKGKRREKDSWIWKRLKVGHGPAEQKPYNTQCNKGEKGVEKKLYPREMKTVSQEGKILGLLDGENIPAKEAGKKQNKRKK